MERKRKTEKVGFFWNFRTAVDQKTRFQRPGLRLYAGLLRTPRLPEIKCNVRTRRGSSARRFPPAFHPSSLILHPSSFILHPSSSSFILHPSPRRFQNHLHQSRLAIVEPSNHAAPRPAAPRHWSGNRRRSSPRDRSRQAGYSPLRSARAVERQLPRHDRLQRQLHLGRQVAHQRHLAALCARGDGQLHGGRDADGLDGHVGPAAAGQREQPRQRIVAVGTQRFVGAQLAGQVKPARSRSTAMIRPQPAARRAWTTSSPIMPAPTTTAVSLRRIGVRPTACTATESGSTIAARRSSGRRAGDRGCAAARRRTRRRRRGGDTRRRKRPARGGCRRD